MTRNQRFQHYQGERMALASLVTAPQNVPTRPHYRYLTADACDSVELSAEGQLKALAESVQHVASVLLGEIESDGIRSEVLLHDLRARARKVFSAMTTLDAISPRKALERNFQGVESEELERRSEVIRRKLDRLGKWGELDERAILAGELVATEVELIRREIARGRAL